MRALPRIPPEIGPEQLSLLRRLAEVALSSANDEEAADSVLKLVADGLSLSSGMINLVKTGTSGRDQLVPSASFGTHAQLSRDMPPVDIDSTYEAAVVFSARQPHYVSDVYGGGGDTSESPATSRWRAMISTQSYAVLPLYLGSEGVGTITLQWPTSQAFPDSLRRLLETLAAVAALAIFHVQCREAEAAALDAAREAHARQAALLEATSAARESARSQPSAEVLATRFEVSEDGDVVTLPEDQQWSEADRIRVTFTRMAPGGFCDVFSASADHVTLFVACLPADTVGPSTARTLVRALAERQMPPEEILSTLNGLVEQRTRQGSGGSAWVGTLDSDTGAFSHAGAGDVEITFESSDGRTWEIDEHGPYLGSSHHASFPEELRVVLPGDALRARCSAGELAMAVR